MAVKPGGFRSLVLAVDPGTKYCGYAVGSVKAPELEECGLVSCRGGESVSRALSIVDSLAEVAAEYGVSELVVEQPQVFGAFSAASNSGSLIKLAMMVGALMGRLDGMGIECYPVLVSQWKGQLPKSVTLHRIRKRYGWVGSGKGKHVQGDDVVDAVGIYDWFVMKGRDRLLANVHHPG